MELRITTLLSHTLVATHWVPYTGYHTLGPKNWVQNTGYHTHICHLPLWNCNSCWQRNTLPKKKKKSCISITYILASFFPRAGVGECWFREGRQRGPGGVFGIPGRSVAIDLAIPGLVFCFLVFMADVGHIRQYQVQPSTVQSKEKSV